jgi:hypothetical protein
LRTKEFILHPNSKQTIRGLQFRHLQDEGWLIDEDEDEILVYTNDDYIGYDNMIWRIPSYYKSPQCKGIHICDKTRLVTVDILVA